MRLSSKWYYVNCGASIEGSLFFAMLHQTFAMIFCFIGGMFSWYEAERRAADEKREG